MRIGVDSTRRRVIRENGKGLEDKYLASSFKSGCVTIMIWGCFSGTRISPLLTFEQGGIGSDEYMDIPYDRLLSMVDDLLQLPEGMDMVEVADENTLLFMHDNAPCHKTEDIHDLLQENNIPVMTWPANSPNLNPIENLWHDLKHRFYLMWKELRSSPSASQSSVDNYKAMIEKCWYEQDGSLIKSLLESMPQCCADVIAAKGGHTGY